MEKFRYHEMLPHEIVERRKQFPAAFIGLGTLEWHGHHLAVGNDALKAEKLCEMAAIKSGGFVFPTLWYGEPRTHYMLEHDNTRDGGNVADYLNQKRAKLRTDYFRRSNEEQVQRFRDLVFHMLIQMNVCEMRAVCLVCGHYPLAWFLEPTIEDFNKQFPDTQAFAGIEPAYSPGKPDICGGDHGGIWETSYLLYLRPDCVDMHQLSRPDEPFLGVGDNAGQGTIEKGRRACLTMVDGIVDKARELVTRSESLMGALS